MCMTTPQTDWKPDFTPITTVDPKTAELVKEAFSLFNSPEDDTAYRDCLSDLLSDLYSHVYPGASRLLTKEESLALARQEPDTIEGVQSQELLQVDKLLFQALANIHRPEVATRFLSDARESLGLFVAAHDLPKEGWDGFE